MCCLFLPIIRMCQPLVFTYNAQVGEFKVVVTMFAFVQYRCSSGRVVPPLAAGRSPTDEIKNRRIIIGLLSLNKDI